MIVDGISAMKIETNDSNQYRDIAQPIAHPDRPDRNLQVWIDMYITSPPRQEKCWTGHTEFSLDLPMLQEENSCSYYMRTFTCKFGAVCKFNHPQPASVETVLTVPGPAAVGSIGKLELGSSQRDSWGNLLYSSKDQYRCTEGISRQTNASSANNFHPPEQPDQPGCWYFMSTGSCRYGSDCKYHHPKDRIDQLEMTSLGLQGLPMRPINLLNCNSSETSPPNQKSTS
ncbi:hypothetical protein Nepgr_009001 [Nepenthes gracilis]|uniref:C3H1-type domain-containing protein n=1 Tax=Nepenthes gracilis TaxID=150966 RepID=A0AAD3SAL1_NEPGR|nr:hypothetical protein Nepgr_009001 [Nepenthes gracilis]